MTRRLTHDAGARTTRRFLGSQPRVTSLGAGTAIAGILLVVGITAAAPAAAQESCAGADCTPALVTPVRIGRADAPLKLILWAQQDYSHLAANREVARIFLDI